MNKKYSAEQIASALQHESVVTDTLARLSRAEGYVKETETEIKKLESKLLGQIEARDSLLEDLHRLDEMKEKNKELFDVFKSISVQPAATKEVRRTAGGRMPKISTKEKILLIERAMKEFDENRGDQIWDDEKTVPLYFIREFIEKVKSIEIGNTTIFLRKAIEEGRFEVVGNTRTRAIRNK